MVSAVGPIEEPSRYEVIRPVTEPDGAGGQGLVYRARRRRDGREVALKMVTTLRPGDWPTFRDRLVAISEVHHPAVVEHLDVFLGAPLGAGTRAVAEDFDVPYVVSAWIEGSDLADAAAGVPVAAVLSWIREIAHGVAALHRHEPVEIVHRDIKPANVRISATGRATLIDFGIARPVSGKAMTAAIGTAGWTPPEATRDPDAVGPASDAWQVGGLAVWALLGEGPGYAVGASLAARLESAARRAGLANGRALARHVVALLVDDPASRPADLQGWADRLVDLATGKTRVRRVDARQVAVALGVAGVLGVLFAVRAATPPTDASSGPPGAALGSTVPTAAPLNPPSHERAPLTPPPVSVPPTHRRPLPPPGTALSAPVVVRNEVTRGTALIVDGDAAYLSSQKKAFGKSQWGLPHTDANVGDQLTAICWEDGDEMTNGDFASAGDDTNPGLVVSTLWYLVRWRDGRRGWISEVWIDAAHRGGMGLARCGAGQQASSPTEPAG